MSVSYIDSIISCSLMNSSLIVCRGFHSTFSLSVITIIVTTEPQSYVVLILNIISYKSACKGNAYFGYFVIDMKETEWEFILLSNILNKKKKKSQGKGQRATQLGELLSKIIDYDHRTCKWAVRFTFFSVHLLADQCLSVASVYTPHHTNIKLIGTARTAYPYSHSWRTLTCQIWHTSNVAVLQYLSFGIKSVSKPLITIFLSNLSFHFISTVIWMS